MAKIFLVLTIFLTCAAAFFGYQTYSKLDTVKQTVEKAKADAKDATTKLQAAIDNAKAVKIEAAAATEKANSAAADIASAKAAADKATSDLTALQTKYDAQAADLKKAQDDLANNPKGGTPPPTAGNPDDAKKIADLQAQLQEKTTLVDSLQNKNKEDEEKLEAQGKQIAGIDIKRKRPGLEGEVMAVNQGWNFVVVSIGDRQGATANAELIIKRGDSMIGKVKITSVEPSTSIADIIPDSVPKGQRVLPGDRVIFPVQ